MHFQWASDDRWSQHVRCGCGLSWNYVTLINRHVNVMCSTENRHIWARNQNCVGY